MAVLPGLNISAVVDDLEAQADAFYAKGNFKFDAAKHGVSNLVCPCGGGGAGRKRKGEPLAET